MPPQSYPVRIIFPLAADVIEALRPVGLQGVAKYKDADIQCFTKAVHVKLRAPMPGDRIFCVDSYLSEKAGR